MTLTVLNVASPFAPVGHEGADGAEAAVAALDAALVRAGHRSLVIGPDGSRVAGELIALPPVRGSLDDGARAAVNRRVRAMVADAVGRTPVDLVHLHGADFHDHLPPAGVPVLATLHRPLDAYPPAALSPARPATWLHGVSAAQRPPAGVHLLPPLEPGVAVDRLAIRVPKRRFAVALGRVTPGSGLHRALDAAAMAEMQILLAGELRSLPENQDYFRAEIQPRLDGRRRYLGVIGFARKRWLLGSARCLLAPGGDGEIGAVAAQEALACGTPVVGFADGPLAGVIEPGVTGFLVKDVPEMAEAIAAAERLDPDACRAAARSRHSEERMAARYLALYEQLAVGEARAAGVA
ncbi:glycosyltransferase [Azospirillum sp.]|uniref:glycosyltransferase n=1 Tax=Azospirillum sp. TaxID=34012 RepID=UPI003D73D319